VLELAQGLLRLPGGFQNFIAAHGEERVDPVVSELDAVQAARHGLHRRYLSPENQRGKLGSTQIRELFLF